MENAFMTNLLAEMRWKNAFMTNVLATVLGIYNARLMVLSISL